MGRLIDADLLLKSEMERLCKTVWFIVDKWTEFAMVMKKPIEDLDLYEISKIDNGGKYYSSKEAAEQALKEMED